jgi:hypothetical protein
VSELGDELMTAIGKLREEYRQLGDKVAALELAYEVVTGRPHPTNGVPAADRRRVKRDSEGQARAFAVVMERHSHGRVTNIAQVMRQTKCTQAAAQARLSRLVNEVQCTQAAAQARLSRLVNEGKIVRRERGVYAGVGAE